MSFENKVILVTGAASGIGADAARHLAKLGGKVALVDRNEKGLLDVIEQIKKSGSPKPLAVVADVTKDVERIIDETIKHFGQLDVLVNNAGVGARDSVVNLKIEEFDRVLGINLRSVIILTSLAVPYLEKTKGNIVNVSSVRGLKASLGSMSYCISKAALNQFTKCTALDLASKGIRVNAINPALVRTPLIDTMDMKDGENDKFFEEYGKKYPIGRVGEVEDTSAAIAYLASSSASFLTGVLLPVDGGSTAGIPRQ